MPTYLVTGATGRQGGSTARELLEAGAKVHALVRNPDSSAAKDIKAQGAILVKGDAADTVALTKALQGVDGVFFNPPYPAEDTLQVAQSFIQTCANAGVETFVLSSTAGTDKHAERLQQDATYAERHKKFQGYWNLKLGTEEAARKAGFENLVILRASLLYHIYLPGDAEAVFPALWKKKSLITGLKSATKVPHLQAEDVGRFSAKALLEPGRFAGREIDLAADNLTVEEVASIIREVSGASISTPKPDFNGVEAVGVQSPIVGYQEWCNEVDARVDTAALKEYGIPLTTMQDYLENHKDELVRALSG